MEVSVAISATVTAARVGGLEAAQATQHVDPLLSEARASMRFDVAPGVGD
jgi:hypothetical protein